MGQQPVGICRPDYPLCQAMQWLVYDTNFRLQATAARGGRWAEVNGSLWTMVFGRAEWKEHCQTCSSLALEDQSRRKPRRTPHPQANLHTIQLQ